MRISDWSSDVCSSDLSNLAFSTDHGVPRSFMVTSTVEAEGKSTTSMALAIVLSRLGHKVVLVDSDMRRPAMHANLGLANAHGLRNYLAGDNEWANLLQRSPIANIDFMSAGDRKSTRLNSSHQ